MAYIIQAYLNSPWNTYMFQENSAFFNNQTTKKDSMHLNVASPMKATTISHLYYCNSGLVDFAPPIWFQITLNSAN